MKLLKVHYSEQEAENRLSDIIQLHLAASSSDPVIICIGSDRHILDCFGPLVGTMIIKNSELPVYGTLDDPLHAKNLIKNIKNIKRIFPDRFIVAIDAAISSTEDIGTIQLSEGSIIPGKALNKNLPPVGDLSITGVVDMRSNLRISPGSQRQSFTPVYHMAEVISSAIIRWKNTELSY